MEPGSCSLWGKDFHHFSRQNLEINFCVSFFDLFQNHVEIILLLVFTPALSISDIPFTELFLFTFLSLKETATSKKVEDKPLWFNTEYTVVELCDIRCQAESHQ